MRLCNKVELEGNEKCATGWLNDEVKPGYWMNKIKPGVIGCGRVGHNTYFPGKAGAYCCDKIPNNN